MSRDGRNLGTYAEDGLIRQLNNGDILPTDLVFLESEQRWVPLTQLPKRGADAFEELSRNLEVATPFAYITPVLIAINVLVFLAMLFSGVYSSKSATADLIRWGANFGPLTAHGQWWRLLTAAFIHVGFIHVALNMWTFYQTGLFSERLLGHAGFLVLYLLSAIGGNLVGLAVHPNIVAAGASGAVFGVYGSLIGLLVVKHESVPRSAAVSLGTSALVFVGYNVLSSLGNSSIDMAAHFGGLLTGVIVGCALVYGVNPSVQGAQLRRAVVVSVIGFLLCVSAGWKIGRGGSRESGTLIAELSTKSIKVGRNDLIFYSGNATADDAIKLGQTLKTLGFLSDRGTAVFYSRTQDGAVVSLMVKEGSWQDPKAEGAFNLLGRLIAGTTRTPLTLRLVNKAREVKKEIRFRDPNIPATRGQPAPAKPLPAP